MIPILSSFEIESTGLVLSFSLASALVWVWDFILSFFRGYINFRTGTADDGRICREWSSSVLNSSVTFVQPLHLAIRDTVFAKIGQGISAKICYIDLYCCSPSKDQTLPIGIKKSFSWIIPPFFVWPWTSRNSFMYSWSTDVWKNLDSIRLWSAKKFKKLNS